MAKARGEITVEANGKRYVLVFNTNALCELEDRLAGGVGNVGSLMQGGRRISTIRAMLLCALLDRHQDLTLQDAGRIMDAIGIDKADAAVAEAFMLAFPEAKDAPVPLDGARAAA